MDRDTIIRLAQKAGLERVVELRDDGTRTVELPHPDLLARFAALVAAHEREECAKVLEAHPSYDFCRCPCECATAIRSRK